MRLICTVGKYALACTIDRLGFGKQNKIKSIEKLTRRRCSRVRAQRIEKQKRTWSSFDDFFLLAREICERRMHG